MHYCDPRPCRPGALTVEVAETFSLDGVGKAFDASRSGRTRGKLVIVP